MTYAMHEHALDNMEQQAAASLRKAPFQRTKNDIQVLAAYLGQCKGFFAGLTPQSLELLCGLVGYEHVTEGGVVCKQGRHGDSMYIVLKGYCSVLKEPALPDSPGSDLAAGSRRATAEQAAQPYASRRNTMEQVVAAAAGSRRSTMEQVALPLGSRRATAEQAAQPPKEPVEPPKHIGWVAQGELINEAALVSAHRAYPNTVLAGDGGVELVTLDRSAFNRLEAQAGAQGSAAAAVQGIMAGCCRRVLQLPVQLRSGDDVDTLAELLRHLEAFKRLPTNVCHRLAKGCTYSHMPAGAVLFEEDSKADSMYVVVSGSCHVRARPLPQPDTATASSSDTGGHAGARHRDASSSGFSAAETQRRRTTADAVLVGMPAGGASARSNMACARISGADGAVVGKGEGGRRRTWEEGAYTEDEQQRLDAILEALKADQEKDQRGLLKHSNAAEKAEKQVTHDSLYWMARYMQGARTNANAQDPNWGMEGGMTPSGAIFAAKWRQTVRDKQAERLAQEKEQVEHEEAAAKLSGMEALLGKGAAKMLRQATADTNDAHTRQLDTGSAAKAGDAVTGGSAAAVVAPAAAYKVAGSGAHAFAADVAGAMQARQQEKQHEQKQQQQQQQQQEQEQQQQQQQQQQQAQQEQHDAEPADPNKVHMAALGAKDPANVSWALLAEIARRSQLSEVLVDVATELTRKGLPKKLGQKACLKLTRELNKCILGGSSRQGLGRKGAGHKADDAAAAAEEGGQEQWEAGTDATGLGDDWRSSLDGSETMSIASLDGYGERSMVTISGDSGTASPVRYNSLPGAATSDALFQGAVQAHQSKQQAQQLTASEAEARYGSVVRTITAGQSIGELALLQRHATRTATLLVADDAAGADLIRISQSCFDATVRALQLAALEELLAFLGSLEPFRALSRDRLTSLAIFCRPVRAGQGEVVVSAGAAVDALYLVQEGELQLLGNSLPANPASGPLAPSRRTSMDQQAAGSQQGSGSRYLIRQLSASSMAPHGLRPAGRPRRMTYDPSDAPPASANKHQRNMASASAAPLAAMGPGSVFGENVLGYADDAEASKDRQAAAAEVWQLQQPRPTHIATVVAIRPCELLLVPAGALKRLASRIREPLMGLAASRREFVQTRIGQLQDTKANLAQAADGNRKELARNQRAAAQHHSPAAGLLPSIYGNHPTQPHPLAAARLHAQQQQQQLPSSLAHRQDIFVSDVKQMTQLVPQTTVPLAEAILRKSSVLAAPAAAHSSNSSASSSLLPSARALSAGLPLPVVPYPIGTQAVLLPPPISTTAVVAERTGAMAPRPASSTLYTSAAFASKLGSVGSVGGSLPVPRVGSALPRSSGGGLGTSSTSARRSTGDKVIAGTNWLFQDALAAGGVVSAAGPLESQGGLGASRGRSSSAGMQHQPQQQQQEQYAGAQLWQAGSSGRLLHSAKA